MKAPAMFAATRRTTLTKDLRLEWRSKDAINSMLFFALLVVVIFSFAFDSTAEESRKIAGGLVWVAVLFAAVVALNQTWAREFGTMCSTRIASRRRRANACSCRKLSAASCLSPYWKR